MYELVLLLKNLSLYLSSKQGIVLPQKITYLSLERKKTEERKNCLFTKRSSCYVLLIGLEVESIKPYREPRIVLFG